MGSNTALRQLLLGLCSDARWKYTVFWKLECESHEILTWGDGYVSKMIGGTHMGDAYDSFIDRKHPIMSFTCGKDGQGGSYAMCPIEATLLNMSCHWYSLGEEIIGKVALMGQHRWIFASQLSSKFMFRYSEDWRLQFAAGIKTVLLVPIIHHGVLQLGSLNMVSEDSTLVAQIKDLFYRLYNISAPCDSSATLFDYSNTSRQLTATLAGDPLDIASHDLFDLIDSAQFLTSDHHGLPLSEAQCDFPLLEDVIISTFDSSTTTCPNGALDAKESDAWTDATEEPSELTYYNSMFEPDMTNLFSLDQLSDLSSKVNYDGCSLMDMTNEYQQCHDGNAIILDDDVVTLNYSVHSELQKEIEAVSREEHEGFMWDNAEPKSLHSLLQTAENNADANSLLENENYAEILLDVIIGDVSHPSNDASEASEHTMSSCHLTDSPTSCATQIQKGDQTLSLDRSVLVGEESAPISINECFMSSVMTDSFPTGIDKPVNEKCMGGIMQELRGSNSPQINKKRRTSGEFRRPRPRDRQLIQGRMKELRELIPNGSKCSIDALLERTITHMLFLQSIAEQAGKLKNSADSKNKVDEQDSFNQTKKKPESCPIRVEELDQPGHILIEMLCKEYGLFLEIAHIIKSLQLPILKGVLENRSDKLWAHFVIQASKGFNQMQILCPLMHLLQRS